MIYKHYIPGNYYHVWAIGNQNKKIFLDDNDYSHFTQKMIEYSQKHKIDILAYVLLPDRFHFLLFQRSTIPLNKFMQSLLVSHVRFFSKKYNSSGHIFQARFKAEIIEGKENLLQLSRYIHQSPLKLVNNFSDAYLNSYSWSSYSEYAGKRNNPYIDTDLILSYFAKTNKKLSYQAFIQTPQSFVDI